MQLPTGGYDKEKFVFVRTCKNEQIPPLTILRQLTRTAYPVQDTAMKVERHQGGIQLIRSDEHRIVLNQTNLLRTRTPYPAFVQAWERAPAERLQPGKDTRITVDVGDTTGTFAVVKAPQIRPQDPTSFSRLLHSRHNRPSRVIVTERPSPETTQLTIIAEWYEPYGCWRVRTVYPGHYVPPQPWDFFAIHRMGLKLQPVIDYWCKSAFLWNVVAFHHRVHDDTIAGLVDDAAGNTSREIVEDIGYDEVRQAWMAAK